ncbi:MAG: carbohydrate kinase [Acidobacteria bacterium]|nr:MAG: carbohydrate kinase [Acidobacteriota bacterium]
MMLVVGLGEVLWDLFPEGKQLGGAPANFAYITNLLGDRGIIASRVGDDALGNEIQQKLGTLGLESSYLQSDSARPTGTVRVRVDQDGQARFEITDMVAWDFLEWTPAWESLAQQADAICFGSLAQRSPASRETIHKFLGAARPGTARIFDVNLRQAFYSAKVLSESLKFADIAKLNAEELPRVVELLGIPHHGEQPSAERLRFAYGLKLVCVTRGAQGSLLVSEFERHEHPGFRVQVADTVGAGDAFTAALVHHFLRGAGLAAMNEAANRIGAWVASCVGATPSSDDVQLRRILATTA